MHLHPRRTSRAVAALVAATVVLGAGAGAPAVAEPDAAGAAGAPGGAHGRPSTGPADGPGLTWSELQRLAAEAEAAPGASSPGSAASPVRRQRIADRRGDAEAVGPGRRNAARLADLTAVAYRTPARRDGELTIRARWADLRDARRPGVRRQHLLAFLGTFRSETGYLMWVGNRSRRVVLLDLSADTMREARVRPERVTIERNFGRGGTIAVTMSTEWLGLPRLRFASVGTSADGSGFDDVRPSRLLDVGPR